MARLDLAQEGTGYGRIQALVARTGPATMLRDGHPRGHVRARQRAFIVHLWPPSCRGRMAAGRLARGGFCCAPRHLLLLLPFLAALSIDFRRSALRGGKRIRVRRRYARWSTSIPKRQQFGGARFDRGRLGRAGRTAARRDRSGTLPAIGQDVVKPTGAIDPSRNYLAGLSFPHHAGFLRAR
jgi:hypothetical protein